MAVGRLSVVSLVSRSALEEGMSVEEEESRYCGSSSENLPTNPKMIKRTQAEYIFLTAGFVFNLSRIPKKIVFC
jgi:hypothetical protein